MCVSRLFHALSYVVPPLLFVVCCMSTLVAAHDQTNSLKETMGDNTKQVTEILERQRRDNDARRDAQEAMADQITALRQELENERAWKRQKVEKIEADNKRLTEEARRE